MHIKVLFLAVLIISIFQITLYGIQHNEHSKKEFSEIVSVQPDNISKIQLTDLSNHKHQITNPKQMKQLINYFNQFEYQRHRNDQTGYMPIRTMMIYMDDGEQTDFIIPYGKEVLISHKTYMITGVDIDKRELVKIISKEKPLQQIIKQDINIIQTESRC